MIDRRLDLKDRLATALEFREATSPVAAWLLEDAEQKARFVEAGKVVPLPPRPTRRGLFLTLAIVASAAMWIAPLPAGVLWADDAPVPPMEELAAEDAIFERAARLIQELRDYRSPEIQRIQRDLADLQAGLRDRSLPKDEAVALLQLLERRAQAALASAQMSAGEPAAGTANLDRLQDLANRLVAAAGAARSGNSGALRDAIQQIRQLDAEALQQNPALERLLDQLADSDPAFASEELLSAANDLQQSIQRSRIETSGEQSDDPEASGEPGESATGGGSESTDEFAGGPGAGGDEGEPAEPEDEYGAGSAQSDAQGDSGAPSPDGGSTSGAGAEAGGEGQATPLAPGQLRELYYLPGSILDGPIRTGVVQTNFSAAGEGSEMPSGFRTISPSAPVDAEAVDREQIPLAYRQTVRRYFQSLEPDFE